MRVTKFYWSYPFFYYTLLKHYRNESRGVSDIAPFMAAAFLSFWCGAVLHAIIFFLQSFCSMYEPIANVVNQVYGSVSIVVLAAAVFSPNVIFFLYGKRYLRYEKYYDGLSNGVRLRGQKVSWVVLFIGIGLLPCSVFLYTVSNCKFL